MFLSYITYVILSTDFAKLQKVVEKRVDIWYNREQYGNKSYKKRSE